MINERKPIDEIFQRIIQTALLEYRFSDQTCYFTPATRYKKPVNGGEVFRRLATKHYKWQIVVNMRKQGVISHVFHNVKGKHLKFDESREKLVVSSPGQIQETVEEMIDAGDLPGQRVCGFCGAALDSRPNKKFCNNRCRAMFNTYKMRKEEFDRVKKPRGRKKKVIPPESTSPAP
ncbi:MAG: hypothetical protein QME27_01045 [Syntrophaceae bacterium]|nr:hypothetical protein [Syntrophaceae bacterium]